MTYRRVYVGGWEDPEYCITPIVFELRGLNWVHTDMARERIAAGVFKKFSKEHYEFLKIPFIEEKVVQRITYDQ